MIDYGAIAIRVATAIVEETPNDILAENDVWEGRGGTSFEVWTLGLRPAFRFAPTGEIFFDPAHPWHMPTAVPRKFWAETDEDGDFRRFMPGIEQGFVFPGHPNRFFSRSEAAAMLSEAPTAWAS